MAKAILLTFPSGLAMGLAGIASAQQTEPPPKAETATTRLESIVVTATKRTASLQDVPVSVKAFGTADIEKHQFNTVASAAMKILNALDRLVGTDSMEAKEGLSILLRMLAPLTPHLAHHLLGTSKPT